MCGEPYEARDMNSAHPIAPVVGNDGSVETAVHRQRGEFLQPVRHPLPTVQDLGTPVDPDAVNRNAA